MRVKIITDSLWVSRHTSLYRGPPVNDAFVQFHIREINLFSNRKMGSYGGHVLPGTCFMIMARVKDLFGIIRSQRTARQTNLKSGRFSSENRFLDSNTDNVGKLLQKSK